MELYLVQHGEATSKEINLERPLTEKGKEDITNLTRFLKNNRAEIDIIWHSTKKRAIETAEILANALSPKRGTEQKEGLAPNDSVVGIFNAIKSEKGNLMIVGHLPFLQKLASLLLVGTESSRLIRFRQGGAVVLQQDEDGTWQVRSLITPDCPEYIPEFGKST